MLKNWWYVHHFKSNFSPLGSSIKANKSFSCRYYVYHTFSYPILSIHHKHIHQWWEFIGKYCGKGIEWKEKKIYHKAKSSTFSLFGWKFNLDFCHPWYRKPAKMRSCGDSQFSLQFILHTFQPSQFLGIKGTIENIRFCIFFLENGQIQRVFRTNSPSKFYLKVIYEIFAVLTRSIS